MKKTFVIDTTVVSPYDGEVREYGDVVYAESVEELFDELKKLYADAVGIKEIRIKKTI